MTSTEWINPETLSSSTGSNMKIALYVHSMEIIQTNQINVAMLIGGISDSTSYSDKTYYGIVEDQIDWQEGPTLGLGRRSHASAIIMNGDRRFLIVAGGWTANGISNNVEIMEITSSPPEQWRFTQGKNLLKALAYHQMVSLGTKVVLIGGHDGDDFQSNIYELTCPTCEWTEIEEQKLQEPRSRFVAFPIPSNWSTTCS